MMGTTFRNRDRTELLGRPLETFYQVTGNARISTNQPNSPGLWHLLPYLVHKDITGDCGYCLLMSRGPGSTPYLGFQPVVQVEAKAVGSA